MVFSLFVLLIFLHQTIFCMNESQDEQHIIMLSSITHFFSQNLSKEERLSLSLVNSKLRTPVCKQLFEDYPETFHRFFIHNITKNQWQNENLYRQSLLHNVAQIALFDKKSTLLNNIFVYYTSSESENLKTIGLEPLQLITHCLFDQYACEEKKKKHKDKTYKKVSITQAKAVCFLRFCLERNNPKLSETHHKSYPRLLKYTVENFEHLTFDERKNVMDHVDIIPLDEYDGICVNNAFLKIFDSLEDLPRYRQLWHLFLQKQYYEWIPRYLDYSFSGYVRENIYEKQLYNKDLFQEATKKCITFYNLLLGCEHRQVSNFFSNFFYNSNGKMMPYVLHHILFASYKPEDESASIIEQTLDLYLQKQITNKIHITEKDSIQLPLPHYFIDVCIKNTQFCNLFLKKYTHLSLENKKAIEEACTTCFDDNWIKREDFLKTVIASEYFEKGGSSLFDKYIVESTYKFFLENIIFSSIILQKSINTICTNQAEIFKALRKSLLKDQTLMNSFIRKIKTSDELFDYLKRYNIYPTEKQQAFIVSFFLQNHKEFQSYDFFQKMQAECTLSLALRCISDAYTKGMIKDLEKFLDLTLPLLEKPNGDKTTVSILDTFDAIHNYITTAYSSKEVWKRYLQKYPYQKKSNEQSILPLVVNYITKHIGHYTEKKTINTKITLDFPKPCLITFLNVCLYENHLDLLIDFLRPTHKCINFDYVLDSIEEYLLKTKENFNLEYGKKLVSLYAEWLERASQKDETAYKKFLSRIIFPNFQDNFDFISHCVQYVQDTEINFLYYCQFPKELFLTLTHLSTAQFYRNLGGILQKGSECTLDSYLQLQQSRKRDFDVILHKTASILSFDDFLTVLNHLETIGFRREDCAYITWQDCIITEVNKRALQNKEIIDTDYEKITLIYKSKCHYNTLNVLVGSMSYNYAEVEATLQKISDKHHQKLYLQKYLDYNAPDEQKLKIIQEFGSVFQDDAFRVTSLLHKPKKDKNFADAIFVLCNNCKKNHSDDFFFELSKSLSCFTASPEQIIWDYIAQNQDENFNACLLDQLNQHVSKEEIVHNLAYMLCNIHYDSRIEKLQNEFVNNLCSKSWLLESTSCYKAFIDEILKELSHCDGKTKQPRTTEDLNRKYIILSMIHNRTFWFFFWKVFIETEGIVESSVDIETIATSLSKNDGCVEQFQNSEFLNQYNGKILEKMVTACNTKKLVPILAFVKEAEKPNSNPTTLHDWISGLAFSSFNLQKSIEFYQEFVPILFCVQDFGHYNILKHAIANKNLEESIILPLLARLLHETPIGYLHRVCRMIRTAGYVSTNLVRPDQLNTYYKVLLVDTIQQHDKKLLIGTTIAFTALFITIFGNNIISRLNPSLPNNLKNFLLNTYRNFVSAYFNRTKPPRQTV